MFDATPKTTGFTHLRLSSSHRSMMGARSMLSNSPLQRKKLKLRVRSLPTATGSRNCLQGPSLLRPSQWRLLAQHSCLGCINRKHNYAIVHANPPSPPPQRGVGNSCFLLQPPPTSRTASAPGEGKELQVAPLSVQSHPLGPRVNAFWGNL